ncbi:hypothetical protein EVU96_09100 [Bacillus infantis]|uniref:hypothetical protein n=1 Tax=Bacillus infantis TaxID=324767 RepID=UPI00101C413F|nr:hypothetical protein [Bacillus infantis]RYI30562.1 hypothetical protein EVU96_09100 [Bacillus infantis]
MGKQEMPRSLRIFLFLILGTLPAIICTAIINNINSPKVDHYYDLFMFIVLPIIVLIVWVVATLKEGKKTQKDS